MRNLNFFVTLLLCVVLSACVSLGPEHQKPDVSPLLAEGLVVNELTSSEPLSERWWRAYDDDNLNQLVQLALENNRSLKVLLSNLRAARSNLRLTTLDYLPTDTISASTGDSRQAAANLGPLAPRDQNGEAQTFPDVEFNSVTFAPRWEIDLFGRVKRQREIAKAQLELETAELRGLQLMIVADVVTQYFRLQSLYVERAVLQRNITIQAKSAKLVETQFNYGRVGQREKLSAQSQLQSTQAALPGIDAGIQETRFRLALLSGYAPGQLDAKLTGVSQTSFIAGDLAIGSINELVARQANIHKAEQRLRAANAEIGLSIANLFPSLSFGGSVGYASENRDQLFEENAFQFSVGPTVSWSITNLIRGKQQIDAAKYRKQAARFNYEQAVLQAMTELNIALSNHSHNHARLELLQSSASSASESARIANAQYQEGATSLLQLLSAQADQLQRELEAQRGVYDVILSQVVVYKVLGL